MSLPKLVFMGTPDFAVPSLVYLQAQGFPLQGIVTRPDKPQGRGYRKIYSPVKQQALEFNLPVWQPDNVNDPDFLKILAGQKPDVIIVTAFGQILKPELLRLPPKGCINLHASLLPKYRGAAPIPWAIARGEKETGITVQCMVEEVDSGNILVQKKVMIGPDETAAELSARLASLGGPALQEALNQLDQAGAGIPQDQEQATLAPRLTREDGRINWSWTAEEIHNRVRGFNPWPGTYTYVRGKILKIITTQRSEQKAPAASAPGRIEQIDSSQGWLVTAGNGTMLRVLYVQCPNKKITTAQALACGYPISIHEVLGSKGV